MASSLKNSFHIQYAVHLAVAAFGLSGIPAKIFSFIAVRFLAELEELGITKTDIKIDKLKEAIKDPKWRTAALKAYEAATAGVLTEEQKDVVRKQYENALRDYATFGPGMSDNKNP